MSDIEIRDAYVAVEVDLPNGQKVAGRSIPWRVGMRIKALISAFIDQGTQESFDELFAAFSQATGITEAQLTALDPNLTLLELVDLFSRFIYRLRPGRTAAPASAGTPETPSPPTSA